MKQKRKNLEFPVDVKKQVLERSGNRCERCGIDFDNALKGEFHHIVAICFGGDNSLSNCSLLCGDCHLVAPNVRKKIDLLIYRHYFLRFASFKEAAQFYSVDNRFDLQVKLALDLAKKYKKNF